MVKLSATGKAPFRVSPDHDVATTTSSQAVLPVPPEPKRMAVLGLAEV